VIVDASADDQTEQMLKSHEQRERLAEHILYFRVSDEYKGLTRQRNFALNWVATDLVAFFDDDIVLLPHCLQEMVRVHRKFGDDVAGVGAFMENQSSPLSSLHLWRVRLLLRMVPNLQPGRYHRSGISTPWHLAPTEDLVDGDWLPGCAMMWKTRVVRETGFYEGFVGYAHGEDLEFSLRARQGRLLVSGTARVEHLYEHSGRPDPYDYGYMAIYNKYEIHRRALPDRTWLDIAWFIYAWTLDTLFQIRHLFMPGRKVSVLYHIAGRLRATIDITRAHWNGASFNQSVDGAAIGHSMPPHTE
jgi:GT2 family glycosyltransferase